MILAAGLLILLGLGLFASGVLTGETALYWSCVAACGFAAVLVVVARVRMARDAGDSARRAPGSPPRARRSPSGPATGARPPAVPATAHGPATAEPAAEEHGEHATGAADDEPDHGADENTAWTATAPEPAGATAVTPPQAPAGPDADGHLTEQPPPRRGAHEARETLAAPDSTTGEPGEEDVEVTDLLLVVDLADEVLVVDEHPRYHLAGCPSLDGREAIPLPMVEARTDGFTPCATCRPVRHLADTERSRRRAARGN